MQERTASQVPEPSFGAVLRSDGTVRFRLWAPGENKVALVLEEGGAELPMEPRDGGWHELTTDQAEAGSHYRFQLGSNGLRVPDPASRYQPEDAHGPSAVVDPGAFAWSDADWRGRPWNEAVVYELHIGTFTPEGTFRAAIDKLDHLVRLGVTAIEILPVADFPGRRNWGYDGVLFYAPDSSYGTPDDLRALVDAAHGKGLMVLLDVVYNHFGPDANYLGAYAPSFFTDRHKTPWGNAINYDGRDSKPVRDFMIENAIYWLTDFHMDGMRFDAVHAIVDDSPKHLLEELCERVRAAVPGRHVHLVLENDLNQARFLARQGEDPRWYDAQWNDDIHHCLHVAATGESSGYYVAYHDRLDLLGRALAEGFAYQGEVSPFSEEERGQPSGQLPPLAFVSFIQNHDQVGNRAFGDRISKLASKEKLRAVACLYLLAPQVPMLFMGEEWAADEPFPFFCDFEEPLADAVRNGRRQEFARFPEFQDPETRERIPDPTAEETFRSAKLDWNATRQGEHAEWLAWYTQALAVRREQIMPLLPDIGGNAGSFEVNGALVRVWWRVGGMGQLAVVANLGDAELDAELPEGREIWREGQGGGHGRLAPWQVIWTFQDQGSSTV